MLRFFKSPSFLAPMVGLGLLAGGHRIGHAAALYSTTALGSGSFQAINDQGQVLFNPNSSSSTYLYSGYGPNAGSEVSTAVGGIPYATTLLNQQGPMNVVDTLITKNMDGNPTPYRIVSTGNLNGANLLGTPIAVNDSGQVVGMSTTPGDPNAKPGDPVAPGHSQGYYAGVFTDLGPTHAYLSTNGTARRSRTTCSADLYSIAKSINDAGQVAGNADLANGVTHAFLYSNGKMSDLGTLPGYTFSSTANGLNASGQVVGESFLGTGSAGHAFLYSQGMMHDLGVLAGDTSSTANAINNSGAVVGESFGPNGDRAFLYSNGVMTDLNSLLPVGSNVHLEDALGINNLGQIVALGETQSGSSMLVLLSPPGVPPPAQGNEVPEPPVLALPAMLALIGISRRGLRRRGNLHQAWPEALDSEGCRERSALLSSLPGSLGRA